MELSKSVFQASLLYNVLFILLWKNWTWLQLTTFAGSESDKLAIAINAVNFVVELIKINENVSYCS